MSILVARLADVFDACRRDVRFAVRRIRRDTSTSAIVVPTNVA